MSDWSAGRATFTTVPSMKAMLEPRMAAARTQRPRLPVVCGEEEATRIAASSHGGLAALTMAHSALATAVAKTGAFSSAADGAGDMDRKPREGKDGKAILRATAVRDAKGGRQGDVFLPDALVAELRKFWASKAHRGEGLRPEAPLFSAQGGRRISPRRVQFAWREWQKKARFGVAGKRPGDLFSMAPPRAGCLQSPSAAVSGAEREGLASLVSQRADPAPRCRRTAHGPER